MVSSVVFFGAVRQRDRYLLAPAATLPSTKCENKIGYFKYCDVANVPHASLLPYNYIKGLTRRHLFNYTNNTLFRLKVHNGPNNKSPGKRHEQRKRQLSQDNDFWDESKVILCTACLFLRDIRDKNGNKNTIVSHFFEFNRQNGLYGRTHCIKGKSGGRTPRLKREARAVRVSAVSTLGDRCAGFVPDIIEPLIEFTTALSPGLTNNTNLNNNMNRHFAVCNRSPIKTFLHETPRTK